MAKADRQQVRGLFAAVEAGLARVRRRLAAGLSPDVKGPDHFKATPLIVAAGAGREAVFLELVKAGANLHAVNELDRSVLQEAVGEHGTLPTVPAASTSCWPPRSANG